MKSVRIKDIALKAKVSTGTVDRVLHNRGKVSEVIRERVLRVIKEMEYEPNLMARALVSTKTYQIAVLIPDYHIEPYWDAHKSGIDNAGKELKRYKVSVTFFVFNPYEPQSFIEKATELTNSKPDGILLSPIFYREILPFFEKWKKRGIPFVLFNTHIAEHEPLSYIGQDSYRSGLLAAKLIDYGQNHPCSILIAHIDEVISNSAHLIKKENGFRNFFIQNVLTEKYNIITTELNRANFASFTTKLDDIIQNTPDLKGIFVTTGKAYEIAAYLEQRGIRDMKIIGYDLLPKNIYFLNKGLISFLINQNPTGQGYWGIHYLAKYLVFKQEVPPVKYLPLDVVTKENLICYTDEDELIGV